MPLRKAMSHFATGVVVLTVGGRHVHGMTANAITSVALDPPLVLCCIGHSAVMHDKMLDGGHFGVSVLSAGQHEAARHFADKERPLGPGQFDGVPTLPGTLTGAPLLAGALAWLECRITDTHVHGDHTIFLGHVLGAYAGSGRDNARALLFCTGHFAETPGTEAV
ncbi:flavin reductase family protein [Streptomyces sp. NPDC088116]|uniref:flavin reductase family protein n=1 Tax=Streptomyces sp. NPDC088116 TaxID=3365825 RepID=UPI0037F505D4